jgi:putative DNA primase/helicase
MIDAPLLSDAEKTKINAKRAVFDARRTSPALQKTESERQPLKLDDVALSEITPRPLSWLWKHYIPVGKLTLLFGDPGMGKSSIVNGIAAGVTTTRPETMLPGNEGMERTPRRVLLWSGEDDPEDTIHERASLAGCDLNLYHVFHGTRDAEGNRIPFKLTDLHVLHQRVTELGDVGLIVIDPITSLLGDTSTNNDASVRSALQPLADFARIHRIAVLIIMHANENSLPSRRKRWIHCACSIRIDRRTRRGDGTLRNSANQAQSIEGRGTSRVFFARSPR